LAGRLAAFWESAILATYGFSGNETIGILCHETERQRKVLPKAVRRISRRIIVFYVLAVVGLGLSVYMDDPLLTRAASGDPIRNYPGGFVIMAERAGIPVLPSLINVLMIIAAFSMANAGLFVAV
jgi:yeast amino acid transporter